MKMGAGRKGLRIVSNSPAPCKCSRVPSLACSLLRIVPVYKYKGNKKGWWWPWWPVLMYCGSTE